MKAMKLTYLHREQMIILIKFRNSRKIHSVDDILSSTFRIHSRIHHQDKKVWEKVREEPSLNSDEAGEGDTLG